MKTVDSLNLIEDLEARAESSISTAIKIFQNLTAEVLLKPSDTGGWSMAQCLEHLNSYGDFYLPQIKTALDQNSQIHLSGNFKSSWVGNYFIQIMIPDSSKKYKAIKKHIPKPDQDAAAVVATFIQQQEVLLSYLQIAKSVDLNTIRIPISIFPFVKLKLGDVFQFIIAHNERHLKQAARNLNGCNPGFGL